MDIIDDLFGPETPMDRLAETNRIEERAWIRDLVALRKQRNLSQEQVGELMGVGQSGVARIEAAERDLRLSSLFRYALAVNAKVHHIVTRAEDDLAVTSFTAVPKSTDFLDGDEALTSDDIPWDFTVRTRTTL